MNFNDKRKEFFSGYNLNLFLSFSSKQIEGKYHSQLASGLKSKPSAMTSMFTLLHLWSLYHHQFSAVHIFSIPAYLISMRYPLLSRCQKYLILLVILSIPHNSSKSCIILLLLEFGFHYLISQNLIIYIFSLLIHKFLHSSYSVNLFESLFCLTSFILLTKDFKYFWAMRSIYRDMTEDLQESSKNINAGYFLLDQFGSIIEKNCTALVLESLLNQSNTSHINQLFSEDICDSCFSLIKKAKKGIESEQEVLFLRKSQAKIEPFSSILIRVIPLSIHSKNLFLLIFRDISSHVAERKILFESTRENQKEFQAVEKKFLNVYLMQKPIEECELNYLRDYLFQQIETKTLINILLGSSDLKVSDFDVKTEVINTIQMIWSKISNLDVKVNLLIDKDIPSVRSDRYKHNLLLKLMIEFISFYVDKNAHLLITVTRSSLLIIQYKFKFFSSRLTEKTLNSLFSKKWLKSTKICTDQEKMKKLIHMCSHLIKILNGQIEETKGNKELKVFKITYSLSFSKGNLERTKNLCFLNYPEDSVIISWPVSILPKRTNLSLNKLRKMIHSKSNLPSMESGINSTVSYEILEAEGSIKQRPRKFLVFVSEKLNSEFINKVAKVADVIVGDFFFAIPMNSLQLL